ncbi:MAG: K+/H+ antiporter subunit F [Pseudomonadota bacterium]
MLTLAIEAAFAMMSLALLFNLWRVVRGPDLPDRILALDTMYINTIALIVLYGVYTESGFYFEAALLIAVMGFVGTVAVVKYLLRGDIVE